MRARRMKRAVAWNGYIKPNLSKIESWKNESLTDKQIAKNLEVSLSTYARAKAKERELQKIG